MSGYQDKRVFMLRIKGGVKKGGRLQSQNASNRVKRVIFAKIKCVFLPYEKLLFYQAFAKNVRVPSKPPPPSTLNLGKESPPIKSSSICCNGYRHAILQQFLFYEFQLEYLRKAPIKGKREKSAYGFLLQFYYIFMT